MKIIERNNNNAILELEVIRKYEFPGYADFINIAKATFDREKAKRVDVTKLPVEFARYDLWKCELTLLDYYCIIKWINREYTGKIVPVEQSYLQTRTAYLFGLNCFYPRQLDHDNRYDKYLPNYFTFFIDRRGTDDFIRALESMEKTRIKKKENVPTEERRAFGEELLDALRDNHLRETDRIFDRYQGFDIILPANMMRERPYVFVARNGGGKYCVEMDGDKALGCAMRIDHLLEDLPNRVHSFEKQIAEAEQQRIEAEADLDAGNPYQDQVEALAAELEKIDKQLEEAGGKAS